MARPAALRSRSTRNVSVASSTPRRRTTTARRAVSIAASALFTSIATARFSSAIWARNTSALASAAAILGVRVPAAKGTHLRLS